MLHKNIACLVAPLVFASGVLEEEGPGLEDAEADGVQGVVGVPGRLDVFVQPENVVPADPQVLERVQQAAVLAAVSGYNLQQGGVHVEKLVAVGHQVAHRPYPGLQKGGK